MGDSIYSPYTLAHRGQKFQFELVAVLALLALFTHNHLFWVAGLLLALIPFPDIKTPMSSIVGSLDKIAKNSERESSAPPAAPKMPSLDDDQPKQHEGS